MQILRDDRGISVVVGTLLVISIILAAFAAIYPAYSRVSVYSSEADHMQEIANSFIDIQTEVERISEGETRSFNISMAAEIPPLVSYSKSGGVLSSKDIDYGYLEFAANNFFYSDQTYIYESGAVVVSENNSWMRSSPTLIYIENLTGNNIFVKVSKIQIQGDDSTVSGSGSYKVEITCEDYINKPIRIVSKVEENFSKYTHRKTTEAWENYLEVRKDELTQEGYDVQADGLKLTINSDGLIWYRETIKKISIKI